MHRLDEGSISTIQFNVIDDQIFNYEKMIIDFYADQLIATSRNPRVANVINASMSAIGNIPQGFALDQSMTGLDIFSNLSLNVHLSGHSIGKTVIDILVLGFKTSNPNISGDLINMESRVLASFEVAVVRRTLYKRLGLAFTISIATLTIFTTFLLGTKLDWRIVLKEIKKPSSLCIGLGLEFFLMPLIAFGWGSLILEGNYAWQLVYLAIGSCPGGGHSPFWTMMLDGNLDLAVAMSFVASVAALGILPFWLFTIGRIFYAGHFAIPYVMITISLFGLICPIFFGLLFKHYQPILAEKIGRIVKHTTVASFLIAAIFGCIVNSYVFTLLDWHHLLCGMLLPWFGYVIAYSFSRWICKKDHADSLAISIENGCLNVAVPTILIQLTLTQPEADLSLVVPVGVVIFASCPTWIYFLILVIKKRMIMPVVPVQIPVDAGSRPISAKIDRVTEITLTMSDENTPPYVVFDATTQTAGTV